MRFWILLAALLAALLVSSKPAYAQGIVFTDQKVISKVQKPEVAFIFSRQNLAPKYDLELKESFLPKVVQAVETKPF